LIGRVKLVYVVGGVVVFLNDNELSWGLFLNDNELSWGLLGNEELLVQGQMLFCNCDIHSTEVRVVLYLQLRGIA